jgi:predicted RNase H-like HicB family nuclease
MMVPEFSGVVTEGDTFEEALSMAGEAIALHVLVERATALVVPVSIDVRDLVVA